MVYAETSGENPVDVAEALRELEAGRESGSSDSVGDVSLQGFLGGSKPKRRSRKGGR